MPGVRGHRGSLPTWMRLLIENLIIHLVCNHNLAVGHWLESKKRGNVGLLEEAEQEIWRGGHMLNGGPFEGTSQDVHRWRGYVDAKNELLRKRIKDIEDRLFHAGLTQNAIPKDKGREVSWTGGRHNDPITEPPLMKIIRDDYPVVKHHLEVLKNWSDYLVGVRTNPNGQIPVDVIHEVVTELERRSEIRDLEELVKLNRMLSKKLRTSLEVKNRPTSKPSKGEATGKGCGESKSASNNAKMREILRQMHRNFSETFLYRNITLEEINQMSKIVDFVERYRGDVRNLKILPGKVKGSPRGEEEEGED